MARRGAKGKGWIRLMRVIIWILAILMILGGVFLGLGVMAAPTRRSRPDAGAGDFATDAQHAA